MVLLPLFCTADVLAPSFMLVLSATVICCVREIMTSLRVRTADRTFSVVLSVVTSSARINMLLYWPDVIDHINGVKDDNRISNLRSVSFKENMKNMPLKSSSSTGVTGVEARKEHGFYVASITVDGKRKYLGSFKLLDDAKQARKEANALYGFHENHGRSQ